MRTDPSEGPITDPRFRIMALLVLAFGFSTLHAPGALALMVLVTLTAAWAFGLSPGALLQGLRLPGLVVGALVAILPFTSGDTVLATLGPLTLRAEGLAAAAGVALRFLCIFALVIALLGSMPMPRLIAALQALGLPGIMTDIALLTLRHIEDLRRDLGRMRIAMRLRGAAPGFRHSQFRIMGWALASLLLHSHARSDRIYRAMILRGHGAPGAAPPPPFRASRSDMAAMILLLAVGALPVALEHFG